MTRFVALGALNVTAVVLLIASGRPADGQAPAVASAVVPYYGAVYGQPGGFTPADAKRVVELLERIERHTAATAHAGKAHATGKGPDLTAAARTHCAGCHRPGTAADRGGGFVLFAGDDEGSPLRPLGTRERQRVRESVLNGDMPPGKKLAGPDRAAFEQ